MSSPLPPPLHHLFPPPLLPLTSPSPPLCLNLNPPLTPSPLATCAWRSLPRITTTTSCRSRCSGSGLIMVSWFRNILYMLMLVMQILLKIIILGERERKFKETFYWWFWFCDKLPSKLLNLWHHAQNNPGLNWRWRYIYFYFMHIQ